MHLMGQTTPLYRLRRRPPVEISEKAKYRLGQLKASTVLEISQANLYRWKKKLEEKGLKGLEDGSRRPKHLRCPRWEVKLIETIRELRQLYPRWGKNKLQVMLRREGFTPSLSTIGRILRYLKQRHLLPELPSKRIIWSKRRSKRHLPSVNRVIMR